MSSHRQQKAVELLRKCAEEADCNNRELLRRLRDEIKREGDGLPADGYEDQDGSSEKRELLPTQESLKTAMEKSLLICECRLCQPMQRGDFRDEGSVIWDSESRVRDYAILILCGCLFLTRRSAFTALDTLKDFVYKYHSSRKKDDLSIFDGIAEQPSSCSMPHDTDHIIWKHDTKMQTVCNACRWKAFKDAFDLESKVIHVYDLPGLRPMIVGSDDVLDMSEKNIPFINQKRLDIKNRSYDLKFYSCEIHSDYNNPKPNKLEGVELFRKVYAYEHHHKDRIREAKSEVRIAHSMMNKHQNVAKLLFAFRHENHKYEVIELLYKRHEGSLQALLKGHIHPTKLKSDVNRRSELTDNFLWKAMVDIVEAVVKVRSSLESESPLDIKPANVLVDTNSTGDFLTLYLTDFGHVAETEPRNATIEYAPPGKIGLGEEDAATYDVWSMACMLLQVLVFINGDFKTSELEAFNSERQGDADDAAFWADGGKIKLRKPVDRKLTTLENHRYDQTTEVIRQIRSMLSIEPRSRGKMEDTLQVFQRAKFSKWPAERDCMMCGTEKWRVFYRNTTNQQTYPANLAVYRDVRPLVSNVRSIGERQQGHEQIYLDIDLGGNTPLLDHSAYRSVSFAPAAFWITAQGDDGREDQGKKTETEDMNIVNERSNDEDTEDMNALWFDLLHKSYTLLFSRIDEYRKFVTLVTGQQIIRKGSSRDTDFRFEECILNGKSSSPYIDGKVQLWKLLSDQDYDKLFGRTSSSFALPRRPTYPNQKPPGATAWKMMLWMHSSKEREKVCVVVDVGETTWKLTGNPHNPDVVIKQAGLPWDAKIRAEIFQGQHSNQTTEKYPLMPIDAAQLQKRLKQKVVTKIEIRFSPPDEKRHFLDCLEKHGFLKQLGLAS